MLALRTVDKLVSGADLQNEVHALVAQSQHSALKGWHQQR
jgi:hypothetical protein